VGLIAVLSGVQGRLRLVTTLEIERLMGLVFHLLVGEKMC